MEQTSEFGCYTTTPNNDTDYVDNITLLVNKEQEHTKILKLKGVWDNI